MKSNIWTVIFWKLALLVGAVVSAYFATKNLWWCVCVGISLSYINYSVRTNGPIFIESTLQRLRSHPEVVRQIRDELKQFLE